MASPLSIRLDERLRLNLEQEAAASGIPLSQLVRDLLETGAKRARRDRIRRDSARVARYVAATPSAQELLKRPVEPMVRDRSVVASGRVFAPGEIVLADWRGDALPKEPNKLRPAVVVEDELFPPEWPNVMLVPLTDDENLVIPDLAVRIDPSADNGCSKSCWAISALLTTTSKHRLRITGSKVRPDQLFAIRRQIALLVGADG